MAGLMSLAEGAALFAEMAIAYEEGIEGALEKACIIIETEAKDVIGTYTYGWPQLAASTQEDRARLGYSANDPLERTGEMRDSIEHSVEGHSGFVGSDSEIAEFQEFGTPSIPPRSFLGEAAAHKGEEAADAVGQELFTRITRG
jgi:hypothetical protein